MASAYTVDSIVNGMASLQLNFGSVIADLSERLSAESSKLEELKRAIAVETENLDRLRKIRLVADALYILRQKHQEKIAALTEDAANQQDAIAKEMAQVRKAWETEETEFEAKVTEAIELLAQQREREAADYQYEIERERKIEILEAYEALRKEKSSLESQVKKLNSAPAPAAAIAPSSADSTHRKNAKTTMRNAQIEQTIQTQETRIHDLSKQLDAALKQVQDLAVKAIEGTSNRNSFNAVKEIAIEQAKNQQKNK
ncbi:MAG: hypothetical protein SVX43_13220 [Cyanobacteriota bacterium]|nr:hypothetical protein [Cyanobacteriota bacterium]